MKNELLQKNAPQEGIALINRRPLQERTPATDVFRRQEPFWKEIRKRIVENNPTVLNAAERLF